MKNPSCPSCELFMEDGFLVDHGHGGIDLPTWAEGAAKRSFWTGVSLKGKKLFGVVTYRCPACGYLEMYAPPPPKKKR